MGKRESNLDTAEDIAATSPQRPQGKAERRTSPLPWGLTVISFLSIFLMLLGYGVALSVETVFGIPHESVYSSAFDLIGLSVYAIVAFADGISKAKLGPLLYDSLISFLPAAAGFLSIWCGIGLLGTSGKRHFNRLRASALARYLTAPSHQDSKKEWIGKGIIVSIALVLSAPVFTLALLAAMISGVAAISFAPMFGMTLGEYHLNKYVVEPKVCTVAIPQAARLSPKKKRKVEAIDIAASCVILRNGDKPLATGRVALATTTMIVLFDPPSGVAKRFPLSGLILETIGVEN